jgi:hypothetical protein
MFLLPCMYARLYVYECHVCIYACMRVFIYIYIYIYIYTYMSVSVCAVCVYIHAYIHTCIYIYIYIYRCLIHTYIHTYIRAYKAHRIHRRICFSNGCFEGLGPFIIFLRYLRAQLKHLKYACTNVGTCMLTYPCILIFVFSLDILQHLQNMHTYIYT